MMVIYHPMVPGTLDNEYFNEYRRYSGFLFAHCQKNKDNHAYCSGHFINKRGRQVYCTCECHQPDERD